MFYSVHGERPVRLSERTRAFAQRTLAGGLSRGLLDNDYIMLPAEVYTGQTGEKCYADAVRAIAERARVRIDPDELFVGTATLGGALNHRCPRALKAVPRSI